MNSLLALIPIALLLVLIAGLLFAWAVRSGQYDDLDAPALDILREERGPGEVSPAPAHAGRAAAAETRGDAVRAADD